MSIKDRIVELQRQVKICRSALEHIRHGAGDPARIAEDALHELMPLDKRYPLQGIVGHSRRDR